MVAATFSCMLCLTVAAVGAEPDKMDALVIETEDMPFAWALQESTGRLFASLPEKQLVVEYDTSSGKETRRFKIAGTPQQLTMKQHWLIVRCELSGLQLIDLKSNETSGFVSLLDRRTTTPFCSRVENGRCHLFSDGEKEFGSPQIVQVDLATATVKRRLRLTSPETTPSDAVMSPDGRRLASISGSRAVLWRFDEETGVAQPLVTDGVPSGPASFAGGSRFGVFSNGLYELEPLRLARAFAGEVVAVHPHLDLVASTRLSGTNIVTLQRLTDGRLIDTVALPPLNSAAAAPQSQARRADRISYLQFDRPAKKLFCARGNLAYVVDLDKPGLVKSPLLLISSLTDVRVATGEMLNLVPTVTDAERIDDVSFEVKTGPSGAQVKDGKLQWTPAPTDIGDYEFELRAVRGEQQDHYRFRVEVEPKAIPVGFFVHGMNLDPTGKYAVCWGERTESIKLADPPKQVPREWAIVDLDGRAVLHREQYNQGVGFMQMDEKYVYLGSISGTLLLRIDREDVRRRVPVHVGFQPVMVSNLGPDQFAVISQSTVSRQSICVIEQATLKRVESHPLNRDFSSPASHFPVELGEGRVKIVGEVFDRASGKPLCFVEMLTIPQLGSTEGAPAPPMRDAALRSWGRAYWPGQVLRNSRHAEIAKWNLPGKHIASALCTAAPLIVSLRRAGSVTREQGFLELLDFENLAVRHSITIRSGYADHRVAESEFLLQAAGRRAVICDRTALQVFDFPDEVFSHAPMPLHFQFPELPECSAEKPFTVRLNAIGGQGARTYHLFQDHAGIRLESRTGELTVDFPAIWQEYRQANLGPQSKDDVARNRAAYQKDTGKTLPENQFAFTVPVRVAVVDASGAMDQLHVVLLARAPLDVPLSDATPARTPADNPGPPNRNPGPPAGNVQDEAFEALNRRARRLEAALEAALDRLQKLEQRLGTTDKPTSQP